MTCPKQKEYSHDFNFYLDFSKHHELASLFSCTSSFYPLIRSPAVSLSRSLITRYVNNIKLRSFIEERKSPIDFIRNKISRLTNFHHRQDDVNHSSK